MFLTLYGKRFRFKQIKLLKQARCSKPKGTLPMGFGDIPYFFEHETESSRLFPPNRHSDTPTKWQITQNPTDIRPHRSLAEPP